MIHGLIAYIRCKKGKKTILTINNFRFPLTDFPPSPLKCLPLPALRNGRTLKATQPIALTADFLVVSTDSQKPSWPALPPVAPPRKTHAPQAASSPASRPLPDALAFHAHPNSLTSNALISRSTLSLDTDCQLATPPVLTPMGSPRLERASSLQGVANVSASNYSTPTGESPATTPTTPRTKMANWSAVISGLNHLMKSKADHPPPFSQPGSTRAPAPGRLRGHGDPRRGAKARGRGSYEISRC